MSVVKNALPGGTPMKSNNPLIQTLLQMEKCVNGAQQESGATKKEKHMNQCVKIVLQVITRKQKHQTMKPIVILVSPGVT
jgi:hypothetical protein